MAPSSRSSHNGYTTARMAIIGLCRAAFLGLSEATPVRNFVRGATDSQFNDLAGKHIHNPEPAEDAEFWILLGVAVLLVLLGGVFAGLTIALMGQDGIYLQVIATSEEGPEKKHAEKVLRLLLRGKHWVLVTLLLSNVIVNETLPIVLDRSLGGGWPAVLGSTVLIVIFGEVIPQSVCVRYGMQIGAFMAPFVLVLMYLLAPIAYPTAKLLDWLLGEDHGAVYKKSGLKTLVTLHKTLGPSPGDRLNQDEVVIINAVLDLKAKAVGDVMTPMDDVFTMSQDTVLDEETMDLISRQGYSRIPIYETGNESNFVGMLLVKILITYDPEDGKKVTEFPLATLPETRPETSCLDILNFFQEGKSHMVLVSEYPGDNHGATGVVTLEDVIEELIGEEIIDESDVFIDVHKAIRRLAPAPTAFRAPKGHIVTDTVTTPNVEATQEALIDVGPSATETHEVQHKHIGSIDSRKEASAIFGSSPKTTLVVRRSSGAGEGKPTTYTMRGNASELREHLKHLGPSNLASRPKTTRINTVKIKPGNPNTAGDAKLQIPPTITEPYRDNPSDVIQGGEEDDLLGPGGKDASDGIQALMQSQTYGTANEVPSTTSPETNNRLAPTNLDGSLDKTFDSTMLRPSNRRVSSDEGQQSGDTVGSLKSHGSGSPRKKKNVARSGSITENYVDTGGVRKVVLETNISSDDEKQNEASSSSTKVNKVGSGSSYDPANEHDTDDESDAQVEDVKKKKKRRHKRKGN